MRIDRSFLQRDALEVAPELLGKYLVRCLDNGELVRHRITEIEVYRGEEDLACHASKGRTTRNQVMYSEGGVVYVYLIYGMYWLLNLVTGRQDHPQAILIRGLDGVDGPGRVGRKYALDKSFYGEDLGTSSRLWLEGDGKTFSFTTGSRIGVDYAGEDWKNRPWRYVLVGEAMDLS